MIDRNPDFAVALRNAATDRGDSLEVLSAKRQQLVVFLRHLGCVFCRQALADLQKQQMALNEKNTGIVVVHMGTPADGKKMQERYHLEQAHFIADPERYLYRAFELRRGSLREVLGMRIWWAGFKAIFLEGHLSGRPIGDIMQLPGSFLLKDGKIVASWRGKSSGDRPDYCELADSGMRQQHRTA